MWSIFSIFFVLIYEPWSCVVLPTKYLDLATSRTHSLDQGVHFIRLPGCLAHLCHMSVLKPHVKFEAPTSETTTSVSSPRFAQLGHTSSPLSSTLVFSPTSMCSFVWFSQCPVRPVRMTRCSWLVFTQTTSSTRVYPQWRKHSRPTSIALPVTQRKRNPSSWRVGIGIDRISSSVIVPYGSYGRMRSGKCGKE
jgi:hypothetical protein